MKILSKLILDKVDELHNSESSRCLCSTLFR